MFLARVLRLVRSSPAGSPKSSLAPYQFTPARRTRRALRVDDETAARRQRRSNIHVDHRRSHSNALGYAPGGGPGHGVTTAGATLPGMKFAIAIPQFYADGEFDPGAFGAYFARAEELGFDSAWAQEGMLAPGPQLGPIETMTYAAACTQRIRLGCSVFVSTLHSPVHLAKSMSTLDQLSRGRIEVGVGTGGKNRPFAAFGVDPARYVTRFTEGIALMKALWTEPEVTFDGEFWQLKDALMEPKPFQKPYPAAVVRRGQRTRAAAGRAAGRRLLRRGLRAHRRIRRAGPDRTGRRWPGQRVPAGDFPIAKRVYFAIDEDAGRARSRSTRPLR